MSFGISVSDFIAVGKLIKDITYTIGCGPTNEYRSLILELHSLQRALYEIEHLVVPSGQEVAVNSIKVAALLCQYPLEDFSNKLKKFQGLDISNQRMTSTKSQIMTLIKTQSATPTPNLQFTWFQEPVRFEDIFGRVIPIPSEYSYAKVYSIILDQFSSSSKPLTRKITAGEYELLDTASRRDMVVISESEMLTPGMSITMAIIVGTYDSLDKCPRPGCSFRAPSQEQQIDGYKCLSCGTWFNKSKKSLPSPRLASLMGTNRSATNSKVQKRRGKGKNLSGKRRMRLQPDTEHQNPCFYHQVRQERKSFKNVTLYQDHLPSTTMIKNAERDRSLGVERKASSEQNTQVKRPSKPQEIRQTDRLLPTNWDCDFCPTCGLDCGSSYIAGLSCSNLIYWSDDFINFESSLKHPDDRGDDSFNFESIGPLDFSNGPWSSFELWPTYSGVMTKTYPKFNHEEPHNSTSSWYPSAASEPDGRYKAGSTIYSTKSAVPALDEDNHDWTQGLL
ncbi:hypothetical protein EJ08DRAFT_661116 [Tothia fuscella]|uniref:Ubiquitin-like domain-containing protein n=1 Tax=Tothia fuscella TaxID=1048955 RepID=A0A9P4TYR7_9PEZI|nr:hypothetical protein EJ08DRAFT_661116 [Tothia fuscella]